MSDRVRDFIAAVNENYGTGVAHIGSEFEALAIPRFSSGVVSLDAALGMGWPFGKMSLIAGNESTGKTLLALKACASVVNYDHTTKLLQRDLPTGAPFEPGTALFVDAEGTFDPVWAALNDFDMDRHVVARPDTAEQAIDVIMQAMYENVFDLIVLDSIAALTPSTEIKESTETWQVGLGARLVNKAFRRWGSALNRLSQSNPAPGPALICLNQIRTKMTQNMHADNRVLPCGMAQLFYSAIIIYTRAVKIEDGDDKTTAIGEYSGVTRKNKTYVPKLVYTYKMGLRTNRKLRAGQIDNLSRLLALAKKWDIIRAVKGGYDCIGEVTAKTQKALMALIEADPGLFRSIWEAVVRAEIGAGDVPAAEDG